MDGGCVESVRVVYQQAVRPSVNNSFRRIEGFKTAIPACQSSDNRLFSFCWVRVDSARRQLFRSRIPMTFSNQSSPCPAIQRLNVGRCLCSKASASHTVICAKTCGKLLSGLMRFKSAANAPVRFASMLAWHSRKYRSGQSGLSFARGASSAYASMSAAVVICPLKLSVLSRIAVANNAALCSLICGNSPAVCQRWKT